MDNSTFPQLSSGALVQYPLRRRRLLRNVLNAYADGSVTTSNLNSTAQTVWELAYKTMSAQDQAALQAHFLLCQGPFLPFTFVDPVDNMLADSGSLISASWLADPNLSIVPNAADPNGGNSAFLLINSGQTIQSVKQVLPASAAFQYCLSVYAMATSSSSFELGWVGADLVSRTDTFSLRASWTRYVSSGKLSSTGSSLSAFISLPPGQSAVIWGPQMEPQISPSRYRSSVRGGLYTNAHYLGNSLTFEAEGPGLTSTIITIETE